MIRGLLLTVALALAVGLLPSLATGADRTAPGTASIAAVAKVERAIRGCANRNRRAAGLGRLRPSRVLARAARLHARNMAVRGFFEHLDPQGRDPSDRVEIFAGRARFSLVGENIAAGYRSAHVACRGWMRSPGHRANILGRQYTHVGGGFARGGSYGRYYVQVLGRPRGFEARPDG